MNSRWEIDKEFYAGTVTMATKTVVITLNRKLVEKRFAELMVDISGAAKSEKPLVYTS